MRKYLISAVCFLAFFWVGTTLAQGNPVEFNSDELFPTWVSDGAEEKGCIDYRTDPITGDTMCIEGMVKKADNEREMVKGIIGKNKDLDLSYLDEDTFEDVDAKGEKLLLQFIPRLIDILMKFIAPLVLGVFVYAGLRFIYAGDNEEDISAAKSSFNYALMGVLFIILAYSFMKSVYLLLL